jgi:very-short-patch-repair endonuclease
MTPAERKLWYEALSGSRPRFLRQRPIDNFIADFYCAKLRLVIELDGGHHLNQREADQARTDLLAEEYDIQVIRYFNNEVIKNLDGVQQDLLEKMEKRRLYLNL